MLFFLLSVFLVLVIMFVLSNNVLTTVLWVVLRSIGGILRYEWVFLYTVVLILLSRLWWIFKSRRSILPCYSSLYVNLIFVVLSIVLRWSVKSCVWPCFIFSKISFIYISHRVGLQCFCAVVMAFSSRSSWEWFSHGKNFFLFIYFVFVLEVNWFRYEST